MLVWGRGGGGRVGTVYVWRDGPADNAVHIGVDFGLGAMFERVAVGGGEVLGFHEVTKGDLGSVRGHG